MVAHHSVVIEGLSKAYGEFPALEALHLEIADGEVLGLLGPNGAGKTTLMRLLMGLLLPSSGSARILGMDCFADRTVLKRQIGYLPDTPYFYDYLTGRELLRFMADVHGLQRGPSEQRTERLLAELQLADAANDFVTNYSLGMKKKMALAMALVHEPRILILDEPTTGLDPLASQHIRQFLRAYADGGRTVLLSTHWLDLAESSCDRVVILHRGRLVASGPPAELGARANGSRGAAGRLEEVFLQLTAEREAVA